MKDKSRLGDSAKLFNSYGVKSFKCGYLCAKI
jgi:hypothetical protein